MSARAAAGAKTRATIPTAVKTDVGAGRCVLVCSMPMALPFIVLQGTFDGHGVDAADAREFRLRPQEREPVILQRRRREESSPAGSPEHSHRLPLDAGTLCGA